MRRPEFIARQSGNPRGWVGRAIARIMSVETITENHAALQFLDLRPNDRVLEVGCGHGRALSEAALKVTEGIAAGVDVSPDMVRMTGRRLAGKSGSVEVRLTDGVHLPFADCSFDKAFSVHTLYFWKEPEATLSEITRVLAPRGILVLVFRDKDDPAAALFPETVYRFYSAGDVRELFGTAGLECTEQIRVSPPGSDIVLLKALKLARDVP